VARQAHQAARVPEVALPDHVARVKPCGAVEAVVADERAQVVDPAHLVDRVRERLLGLCDRARGCRRRRYEDDEEQRGHYRTMLCARSDPVALAGEADAFDR
jgi:hypothetical protein